MIEVTDEMRRVGADCWKRCREMEVFPEQAADAAYRAMRALEPVPPELRNRQAPPPEKAGDPGMRPGDQARGCNPPTWGANPQVVYSPMQDMNISEQRQLSPREQAKRTSAQAAAMQPSGQLTTPLNPREGATGRMFNDPAMAEIDRRIAALETKPKWVNTQQGAQATPGSAAAGHFGPGDYVVMPAFYHLSRPLTEKTWGAMNRRLDALTAFVLELARRSPGYPPGDATLQRLIAELEPTP